MLALLTIEGVDMCTSTQGEESVNHCDTHLLQAGGQALQVRLYALHARLHKWTF